MMFARMNKTVLKLAGAAAGLAMVGASLLGGGARSASADFPVICPLKPDIVMERAQLQKQGAQTQVRISFRNNGCAIKKAFWSTVMVDTTTYYFYTPSMGNFETVVRLLNIPAVSPGQHGLHIALDWHSGTLTSTVAESNEYNNFFYQMVAAP